MVPIKGGADLSQEEMSSMTEDLEPNPGVNLRTDIDGKIQDGKVGESVTPASKVLHKPETEITLPNVLLTVRNLV